MKRLLPLLLLAALVTKLELAAAACAALQGLFSQPSSSDLRGACYAIDPGHQPASLSLTSNVTGPLTWDHQYSIGLLTVRSNATLSNITMLNVLLAPPTREAPAVPAIFNTGEAELALVSCTMQVLCATLRALRNSLPSFNLDGIRSDSNSSVYIQSFYSNQSRLLLQDVTITCTVGAVADNILVQASTGVQVQQALDIASRLWASVHIDLLDHITFDGLPKQTWPKEGYRVPKSVSFHGLFDGFTVIDLAGIPAFLRVEPGQLLHFYKIQVQGMCSTKVPLVPGVDFTSTNEMWFVYTGDGLVSQSTEYAPARIVKVAESHDSVVLNTPMEQAAALYWFHLVPPAFTELSRYSAALLVDALVTPEVVMSNITNTSISYVSNEQPSTAQYNTTGTSVLPVDVPRPGFNKTAVYSCNAPARPPLNVDSPLLDVNRTTSPVWVANRGRSFMEGLTGAAYFLSRLIELDRPVYAPPLVLVVGQVTLPANISNRLVAIYRDMMLYGPAVNLTLDVPGNPTSTTLDLQSCYWLIRLNDGGDYTLFLTRLTLFNLPVAPLSASSRGPGNTRTSSPGVPSASEPMFALPLFFIRMSERVAKTQVRMRAMTLSIPRQEWIMMYITALKGAAATSAWPLVAGFTEFQVGSYGVSQQGVHLSKLVGWGFNATNLWLIPDVPIEQSELDRIVLSSDARSGALPPSYGQAGADAGNDGASGPNSKVVIGAAVGGVVGLVLMLAGIVFLVKQFKERRQRLRYTLSVGRMRSSGGLDSQGSTGTMKTVVTNSKDGHSSLKAGQSRNTSNYSSNTNVVSQTSSSVFASQVQWSSVYSVPAMSPHHTYGLVYSEYDGQGAGAVAGGVAGDSGATADHTSSQRTSDTPSPTTPADSTATAGNPLAYPDMHMGPVAELMHDGDEEQAVEQDPPVSLGYCGTVKTTSTSRDDAAAPAAPARGDSGSTGSLPSLQGLSIAAASDRSRRADTPRVGSLRVRHSTMEITARGTGSGVELALQGALRKCGDSGQAGTEATASSRGSPAAGVRQNSGLTSTDHSTDSSLSRWDPKKQVAAMALGMQADGDKLQLLEPIGRGGFGVVYRGKWRGLEVAVKTVLFSETGHEGAQQRAVTEAAVCTSVLHPNVVATYHYDIMPVGQQGTFQRGLVVEDMTREGPHAGPMDWKLFLVQEYCHASLLTVLEARLMHPNGLPDLDLLLTNLLDIAHGMAYLHSKNILHGDLKPENVLLKNEAGAAIGVVSKITDFGLATCLDPQRSHISNVTNGTPYYAAPEVVTKGIINKASDVYSFGVLMWEMFLVESPWVKTAEGYQPNARFPHFPDTTPVPYAWLASKCLDPENRARPDFPTVISYLAAMHDAYLDGFDTLVKPAWLAQVPAAERAQPVLDAMVPVTSHVQHLVQAHMHLPVVMGASQDEDINMPGPPASSTSPSTLELVQQLRLPTATVPASVSIDGTDKSGPLPTSRRNHTLRSQAFTSMLNKAQEAAQSQAASAPLHTTRSVLATGRSAGGAAVLSIDGRES